MTNDETPPDNGDRTIFNPQVGAPSQPLPMTHALYRL
jgi:hypothetical protein